ncbi:MAG: alpha/beta hydrolase [Lysobacterales bacterium]
MYLLGVFILLILAFWGFERFYLRGNGVSIYPPPSDPDAVQRFTQTGGPGPEHQQLIKAVRELTLKISIGRRHQNLQAARTAFDAISDGLEFKSDFLPVDAGGIPAEWVIAPGADGSRRMLYIHGGGFVVGSPKSHRNITSKFSEITGCAVLAIDYRLMPEHLYKDCIEDCRSAYHWILSNGPDGTGEIRQLFIGGDSAGGNLTLSLIAWIRDSQLRAPEAVVALSPLTDVTFSGASLHDNLDTDIMLKPFMKPLTRLPQFIKSWYVYFTYKVRPCSPVVSPLLGDLAGLPPTLVQASEAEMLLDDARRYVYKACACGSPAKMQTWPDMLHIWQIFDPQIPQAVEAWGEIGKFLQGHASA